MGANKTNKFATVEAMLNKALAGLSGLAFTTAGACAVAALTVQAEPHPGDSTRLWMAAVASTGLGLLAAIGWAITRNDGAERARQIENSESSPIGSQANAERGATSVAAGRDVNYYTAPTAPTSAPGDLHDIIRIDGEEKAFRIDGVYHGKYLRIKFTNTSNSVDLVCHARLEQLQLSKSADGWFSDPTWFSPGLLWWAKGDGGSDTARLGRGANRSCDVACYESRDDQKAKIVWADDTLRSPGVLFSAYWRVTVRLEAEGFMPVDVEAVIRWQAADIVETARETARRRSSRWTGGWKFEEILSYAIQPHFSEDPTIAAIARFNELIEQGDAIAAGVSDVSDETLWRVAAEVQIEVYCDGSMLTDFRTARDPRHPRETVSVSGPWITVGAPAHNRVRAQLEVLRTCRDALRAKP